MHQKQIAIADPQHLTNLAISTLLKGDERYTLAGSVFNLHDLNLLLAKKPIDLLITDAGMFDYDGFESLQAIARDYSGIKIMVLSNQISRTEFAELSKLGIKNMVLKTADTDEVLAGIEASLRGKKFYCSQLLDLIMDAAPGGLKHEANILTPSEVEIVRMISSGLTTKQIASQKHISFHTVMTHRKNIFRKLEVSNVSELIMRAMRAGIIDSIEYYI